MKALRSRSISTEVIPKDTPTKATIDILTEIQAVLHKAGYAFVVCEFESNAAEKQLKIEVCAHDYLELDSASES
jgi:hypothetical protein